MNDNLISIIGPAVRTLAKPMARRRRIQRCRKCGCTEDDCRQCIAAQGFPCSWVDIDLCSRCENEDPKI